MKTLINLSIFTQISSSILGILWISYLVILTISLGFIVDPGNPYQPQLGNDTITRFLLYLLQHPGLIIFGSLNIIYSSWRGFEKSKKHLGL